MRILFQKKPPHPELSHAAEMKVQKYSGVSARRINPEEGRVHPA